MPAYKPEDVDYLLAQAFNARDLRAAAALYEDDAAVRRLPWDQSGTVAKGSESIVEVMSFYIGLDPKMELAIHHVTTVGDMALMRSQWRISGTGRDGEPVNLQHNGMELVRRQSDGTWKFLIDHPYGADARWTVEEIPPMPADVGEKPTAVSD